MDIGLLGGLGYQLDFGLSFGASYYSGLNNISHYNYDKILGYDPDIYQGVIQVSTRFRF